MQKRLIRGLIFIMVALGLALGVAGAAGAVGLSELATDGMSWGLGGGAAAAPAELAAA